MGKRPAPWEDRKEEVRWRGIGGERVRGGGERRTEDGDSGGGLGGHRVEEKKSLELERRRWPKEEKRGQSKGKEEDGFDRGWRIVESLTFLMLLKRKRESGGWRLEGKKRKRSGGEGDDGELRCFSFLLDDDETLP